MTFTNHPAEIESGGAPHSGENTAKFRKKVLTFPGKYVRVSLTVMEAIPYP
jgi:hypothetical protein